MTKPGEQVTLPPIDARFKLSALWVAALGWSIGLELVSSYDEGFNQETISMFAELSEPARDTWLTLLFVVGTMPVMMVYLTLVLPYRINRGLNIAMPVAFAFLSVIASFEEGMFFMTACLISIVIHGLMVYHAAKWEIPGTPAEVDNPTPAHPDTSG